MIYEIYPRSFQDPNGDGMGDLNKITQRLGLPGHDAEHNIDGNQPLFVFDNHDNVRSLNRYGDGTHDTDIARAVATILLTSRSTALTYYGEERGRRCLSLADPLRRF